MMLRSDTDVTDEHADIVGDPGVGVDTNVVSADFSFDLAAGKNQSRQLRFFDAAQVVQTSSLRLTRHMIAYRFEERNRRMWSRFKTVVRMPFAYRYDPNILLSRIRKQIMHFFKLLVDGRVKLLLLVREVDCR
jgi:hypothetical protein